LASPAPLSLVLSVFRQVVETSLNFFYLAIMLLITSYMSFALFGISAARQVRQIRSNALLATLRQEMVCWPWCP
jgi:hypothetical protein